MARTIVVTGAESGIGAACAAAFGAGGDRVAVGYFADRALASKSCDAVAAAGGEAMAVQCHVDDEGSVDAAFTMVEQAWGPAEVLVNSAGLNMSGVAVRAMTLAQWRRMLDTDLTGGFLTSRRFLTGRGDTTGPASIIHISSIHAYAVRAGGADYCAAKGGLTNLVETLAIEEAARGIRVNAIEPGMILTPMNERASQDETYRRTLEQNIPVGRAGKASEVADLAVFLASDKAQYITGARIVIDGGLSLMQALGAWSSPIADPHVKDAVENAPLALDFNVQAIETVTLSGPATLMARDLMSPFIWAEPDGRLGIMVRAVTRPGEPMTDTGIIWAGWSEDGGRSFAMLDAPSIVPGPDAHDAGGVEDPTVVRMEDGGYVVYYSGVLADMAHGELSYASGPSVDRLVKSGVALASSKSEGNTKEATVGLTRDGKWRLFYEYAADEASRVGLAIGDSVAGPWTEQPTPFMPRDNSWDNWHLSTGPLLLDGDAPPVMFYNGATHDARWRVGWVAFDADCRRVVARGIEPLITPPPAIERTAPDIAFAASVVVVLDEAIWLYYSLEDRFLARARIRRS